MKITRSQLRRLIKEELSRVNEGLGPTPADLAPRYLKEEIAYSLKISHEKANQLWNDIPENVRNDVSERWGESIGYRMSGPDIAQELVVELQRDGHLPNLQVHSRPTPK